MTALKQFATLKNDLDGPVVTLVATIDSAEVDNSLHQILGSAAVYEERAYQMAAALEKKTAELGKQLHDPTKRVEPELATGGISGDQENRGQCESMLRELRELDEAFAAADLGSWQTIHDRLGHQSVGQIDHQPKTETTPARKNRKSEVNGAGEGKLADKIANLTDKLYSLQQLAYNLWALREIHSAEEDTDNWDVPLARIDTGLLHPTVASLYQRTYEEKIKKVEDPLARTAKAKHVLSSPKTGLSTF